MSASGEKNSLRERDFAGILEDTDELVTVVDENAEFLWVNHASRKFFGTAPLDCLGRPAFELIQVEDVDATHAAFKIWVETPGTRSFSFENSQVDDAGKIHYLLWTVTRRVDEAGEFLHLAATAHDVSAMHEREARLARGEARLRALFQGTLDALVVIDFKGTIVDASESVHNVFGWRPDELVGQNVKVLMPEPFHSQHDGYLDKYMRTGETWILNTTREFPVVHRDRTEGVCALSVSRVDVPGGDVLFLGSFRDVTERHHSISALRQSEARFRAVFEQEYQFVGLLRPDGKLLEANASALAVANATRDDVVGQFFWDGPWFASSDVQRRRLQEAVRRAAAGAIVREEFEIVTAGGELRIMDFSVKPLVGEDGGVELLIPEGRDITALKRAQERETGMLRSLAVIGESASILVHEIKNPITAVNLALQAVADKLGEDQRVIIEDLSKRMKKLEVTMRRTLSFAKPLELARKDAQVSHLFEDVYAMLAPELDARGTKLELEAVDPALSVFADRGLIEELLINLVRNAIDALDGDGVITLRAYSADELAVLEIEDDGPGVPPRVRERLFEPFHSTKEDGNGLGLALCRKVAEEHAGSIACVEREESGALFRVRLPRGS